MARRSDLLSVQRHNSGWEDEIYAEKEYNLYSIVILILLRRKELIEM